METATQVNESVARVVQHGAGEAAAALSRLLRREVDVVTVGESDVRGLALHHARTVVLLAFETTGGIGGHLVFVLDEDVAAHVAAALVGGGNGLTRTSMAALAEVGNIAASAFLNAAARQLGATCLPSVPRVSHAPVEQSLAAALPARPLAVARLEIVGVGVVSVAFATS